jgi:hypothetical protein
MYHGWMRIEYLEEVGAVFVLSFPLLPSRSSKLSTIIDPIEVKKETHEEK